MPRKKSKPRIPLAEMLSAGILHGAEAVDTESAKKLDIYRENADPERFRDFAYQFFGVKKFTPDQDKMIDMYVSGAKRIAIASGNGLGKTWLWGMIALHYYVCSGAKKKENGLPQGARLVLSGPAHGTVQTTSLEQISTLYDLAEVRGTPLPGSISLSKTSKVVSQISPSWFMSIVTPATGKSKSVSSSGSGQHSKRLFVLIEESPGVSNPVQSSLEMLATGSENIIVSLGNPTEEGGWYFDAFNAKGSQWKTANLSNLDHPNVTERAEVFPGGMSVERAEAQIREKCIDLGPISLTDPDPEKHDFVWALPDDSIGCEARADGRGAVGYPLKVYRPTGLFFAQIMGLFPLQAGKSLFSLVNINFCFSYWEEISSKGFLDKTKISAIGIDPADGGPDQPVSASRWGNPAVDVLDSWHKNLQSKDPVSLEEFRKSNPCGIAYITAMKPGDGKVVAQQVFEMRNDLGKYIIDEGSVGTSARDFLQEMTGSGRVMGVKFQNKPEKRKKFEVAPLNVRAQMYLRFSELVRNGLIALPPNDHLKAQLVATHKENADRSRIGSKEPVVKLIHKDKIKKALNGKSPDHADAVALSLMEFRGPAKVVRAKS